MDIKKTLLATLLLTFLAACSSDGQDQNTQNKAEQASSNIMISRDGVGPINASTPFNMHQVTRAFQDYSVTEYTQFKDGGSVPIIRVSEEGKPLLLINPDQTMENIFSVFVLSPKIGNALGHHIGMAYKDIYNYDETEPCIAGTEDFAEKVLCIAPKTSNILYVFSGKWDGPKDEAPPAAIMSSWTLDSIIWRPN